MDLNGKLRDLRDQGNISAFNGKLRQEGLWPADETKAEQNARDFIFNLVTAIESADEICGIPAPYLVELKGTWKSFFHFEKPSDPQSLEITLHPIDTVESPLKRSSWAYQRRDGEGFDFDFDFRPVYLPLPTTNGPYRDLDDKSVAIPVYDMHQYLSYLFTIATIGAR